VLAIILTLVGFFGPMTRTSNPLKPPGSSGTSPGQPVEIPPADG